MVDKRTRVERLEVTVVSSIGTMTRRGVTSINTCRRESVSRWIWISGWWAWRVILWLPFLSSPDRVGCSCNRTVDNCTSLSSPERVGCSCNRTVDNCTWIGRTVFSVHRNRPLTNACRLFQSNRLILHHQHFRQDTNKIFIRCSWRFGWISHPSEK